MESSVETYDGIVSRPRLSLLVAVILCWGCSNRSEVPSVPPVKSGPICLEDVSDQTTITFVHTDGSSGRRYIVEPMSAGLALFDYDGDGWIDVYLLNGKPLPGGEPPSQPPRNALYRNLGGWQFQEVTEQAGVGDEGFGLGVTVGDYDNDGYPDLFLNNFGPNVLYHNNGDGTFTDVTQAALTAGAGLVGAGASFLDIEADGDLDLYVTNYLDFDFTNHKQNTIDGLPSYPSPRDYRGVSDSLYRNEGDGTFTDISESSGVASVAGTGMGMVCADYDGDGDTDVFVLNDVAENFFFENDGQGKFTEVGVMNGTAYNWAGDENASMGVDCGDYDHDGRLDFLMTSYQTEQPVLYRNLGMGVMEDVAHRAGLGADAFPHVNWGSALVDFDNDGFLDAFIANGHTEDNVDLRDATATYRARNFVMRNDGQGSFQNISGQAGSGMQIVESSRGAAFDDLDNDGDVDGVVLNSRSRCSLLRNDSPAGGHWLQLVLRGTHSNRDAVGSQVTVTAGDLVQLFEVHSGRGYQSHYGSRIQVGLGTRTQVDSVEIRWMGGSTQKLQNLWADRELQVIQDKAGQGSNTPHHAHQPVD